MDPPYPLMEEYDFRKDSKNPAMTIALKPTNKVRPTTCVPRLEAGLTLVTSV